MLRFLIGLFITLHGLVHLWYFTLSQRLVEFKPEMGWTGRSWLLTSLLGDPATRSLAGISFVIAAVVFVISGFGMFLRAEWWRPMLLGSTIFSLVILFLLWDGNVHLIVQKGLIGFLISLAVLIALLLFRQPSIAF